MKTAFCTYCSADKVKGPEIMPALARYKSRRIEAVHEAAGKVGFDFYIFSGKYGFLKPEDPIPFYDHLMVDEDVAGMVTKSADQLKAIMADTGVQVFLFFSPSLADDPLLGPYQLCLQQAGDITLKVFFNFHHACAFGSAFVTRDSHEINFVIY